MGVKAGKKPSSIITKNTEHPLLPVNLSYKTGHEPNVDSKNKL
ncbi:hypothetical protein [Runella sp.]|jgi:hypothetical protein